MSSSVPDEVVVGYAERGQVVPLHVGQRLVVTLGAGWAAPSAHSVARDPEPPLQPLSTEHAVGFPAGPASATFLAVRCGGALVSAHTDTACLHSTPPCAIAQRVFDLSVQVTPVPGTGSGPLPPAASALTDPGADVGGMFATRCCGAPVRAKPGPGRHSVRFGYGMGTAAV